MAILEVILQQTYQGQECVNRFNYISGGTPAAVSLSFALTSALGAIYDLVAVPPAYPPTGLMRIIAAQQVAAVTFDFISVRDLYSVTDFYETPFLQPLVGSSPGEGMSPAMAMGFRTNRTRADIRRGSKRLTGISETLTSAGGFLSPGALAAATGIATAMSAVLNYNDEGNALTFTPCIMGREKYIPDPTKPERVAYRKYPTEAEQMQHVATSIIYDPYATIRTQTSRQYGRGR